VYETKKLNESQIQNLKDQRKQVKAKEAHQFKQDKQTMNDLSIAEQFR
jgi:hypothetical protein